MKIYAQVGRPDRACPFLHRALGTPPSRAATLDALTTLGDLYLELGRREEAITIYRVLERHHEGDAQCRDQTLLRRLGAR